MQLAQVDLNLFTIFDAIYRERGITAAARRLHLSQPAVSHALARLRDLLEDPLFERHGNEMVPTPRARDLAGTVSQALGDLTKLLHPTTHFDPAACQRTFVIAMRESHEATLLPKLIQALDSHAPHAGVSLVRLERRDLEEDLQTGEVDVAIDMSLPLSTDVQRQQLRAEPLVVLARAEHPAVRGKLDLPTYLSSQHVLVTGRRRGTGFEDAALQRLNLTRQIRVRCRLHAAANEVVARSELLATMVRSQAEQVNRHTANQVLEFPVEVPAMELFMYWHTSVAEDPAHAWFKQLVASCI